MHFRVSSDAAAHPQPSLRVPLPNDAPPDSGLIELAVSTAPVSLQATATKKAGIVAAVRAELADCEYLLTGDVQIEIRWGISVRSRYERDSSADVDNIVKPILDALCGPDGILVDDCQVQALLCYWSGGYSHPEQEVVEIRLTFDPEAWAAKAGLTFLQVERGLYVPLQEDLPADLVLQLANGFVQQFRSAQEFLALGASPEQAFSLRPAQRVFHRSKIGAFRTTTLDELRERLG